MSAAAQPAFTPHPVFPITSGLPALAAALGGGAGGAAAPVRALQATSYAGTLTPSVLLVDPDERARSLLQVALSRDGFEVVAVASAEEAHRQLGPERPLPALVLCETKLPGADGFTFCGQLRAELRTAHLPVLLLSDRPDVLHRELAGGVGADDYLAKPVFVRDLVSLARLKVGPRAVDGSYHSSTESLPVPELLRALLAGVRSGRIDLMRGGARITFRQGRVVDATFEKQKGEEALLRILLLAEGEYAVTFGPSLERAAFSVGLREFCANIFPRACRWRELSTRTVPLTAQLTVDFARLAAVLGELPDGINGVIRLFDGYRSVRQAVLESPLEEVVTLEVVTRLYALGVLAPADDCAPPSSHTPGLFDPVHAEAEERMNALFGDRPLSLPEQAGTEVDDWCRELEDKLLGELTLTVDPSQEWQAVPLAQAGAKLSPDLSRQLEAFNIQTVVDAPVAREVAPPAPTPPTEAPAVEPASVALRPVEVSTSAVAAEAAAVEPTAVAPPPVETSTSTSTSVAELPAAAPPPVEVISFARGAPSAPDASLDAALRSAPVVGELGRLAPVRPAVLPQAPVSVENSFFGEETAPPVEPRASAARQRLSPLWGVAALGLVGSAVAITAWPRGRPVAVSAPPPAPAPVVLPAPAAVAPAAVAPPVDEVPPELAEPMPATPSALDVGIRLYESGHASRAAEHLSKVVESEPRSGGAWLFLGLARFDSGDARGAEEAARRALALESSNGRAMMLLATIFLDAGQRPAAEVQLRRYLELEPSGMYAAEARQLLSRR